MLRAPPSGLPLASSPVELPAGESPAKDKLTRVDPDFWVPYSLLKPVATRAAVACRSRRARRRCPSPRTERCCRAGHGRAGIARRLVVA